VDFAVKLLPPRKRLTLDVDFADRHFHGKRVNQARFGRFTLLGQYPIGMTKPFAARGEQTSRKVRLCSSTAFAIDFTQHLLHSDTGRGFPHRKSVSDSPFDKTCAKVDGFSPFELTQR
jgi:hypothetical protein